MWSKTDDAIAALYPQATSNNFLKRHCKHVMNVDVH